MRLKPLTYLTHLVFLLVSAGSVAAQTVTIPASAVSRLDSVFQAYAVQGAFSGAVLLSVGDSIVLEKGYGIRNRVTNSPNEPQTIYRLGSVTKQFTAFGILRLVDAGKISLQDPLAKWLPEFPNASDITVHHLLCHTSGLKGYTELAIYDSIKTLQLSPQQLIAVLRDSPTVFKPGLRFEYSNTGYAILGYLLEQVTGTTYGEYLSQEVFRPLGMASTGYTWSKPPAHLAQGYKTGLGNTWPPADSVNLSVPYAAGALCGTVKDLLAWNRALDSHWGLSEASYKAYYRPNQANYAYGWVVAPLNGKTVVTHTGGIDGFSSLNFRILEDSLSFIVLQNVESSPLRLDLVLLNALYGVPYTLPVVRTEAAVGPDSFEDYEGTYALSPTFKLKVYQSGEKLMVQATGQPALQIFPERTDFFFYKAVDAQLEFLRDDKGRITSLVLHQNGQKVIGTREN